MTALRWCLLLVVLCFSGGVHAQSPLPDHRYLLSQDTDFFGADLTNLFDTDEASCARACSAQAACVAYTFNQRNNACFPKSAISDRQPYVGALSARKVLTDPTRTDAAVRRAAALESLTEQDLMRARDFVDTNARRYSFSGETIEDLTVALRQAEQRGDTAAALRWAGKAAALSDRADLWTSYSRLALVRAEATRGAERRRHRREAVSAAVNGYLRSDSAGVQVEALRALAATLEANRRGRDVIPALRLAQAIQPREEIAVALDDAIGKYGFRIVNHRVDNAAAAPRICAEFSEDLAPAGVDYAPFVKLDGQGLAIEPQEAQLCVDGVRHGERYVVTFRSGLPAASGEVLHKDVTLRLYVRDRPARVSFPGRAYVLPRAADAALPVETVNTDALDLILYRVSDRNLLQSFRNNSFGRPLSGYDLEQFSEEIAREVWRGTGTVQSQLNIDVTTRLPMSEALADQPPGVYVLRAAVPGQDIYDQPVAAQWFVLTDLGISTWSGVDGLHVAVRSLRDASSAKGVTVALVNRANTVLARVETNTEGFAHFPAGLTRGTGSAAPAMLTVEAGSDDFAFLSLIEPAFDLSDRGVVGRPPAPPIDTFLSIDRGAYRVGEVIHATALTRDRQAASLRGLPVSAILKRPDGVEYARQISESPKAGGHVFSLSLGLEAPRGAWRLDILSDVTAPPLASQVILVEDFLPERIDFDIRLPAEGLRFGQSTLAEVQARYLFGAPGADLAVSGETRLTATRVRDGWDGYLFGRHDADTRPNTQPLQVTRTNAEGLAQITLDLGRPADAAEALYEAEVTVRVAEGSGRPVERTTRMAVVPETPMIGVKPAFDGVLERGDTAGFQVIAVDPSGGAAKMPVRWTVNKVERRYQWYQLYGNWSWEPVTRRVRVATGDAQLGAAPLDVSASTDWGTYEIVVERLDAPYAVTSVSFQAGWYGGDGASDTPDLLQMSLDAEAYDTGDTARLTLMAQDDGVALLSVLSNQVVERRSVPVTKGENLIDLSVTQDWGSGAYVTASVLRGMDLTAKRNPARQLGVAHASVNPGPKALEVKVTAPQQIDGQEGEVPIVVDVSGVAAGETAYVTLAAVDVGVLNLTGFEPPDVSGHYFGQRRLGVDLRDVYGRLIDGMNGAMGQVRSGGDASARIAAQSPPPTEDLMAFFAGPVEVGSDGRAEFLVSKPAFNGTIRLMAIAWTDTAVGDATADVVAKDPVVVTASLPRFLAPGDDSRMLLELVHASGPAGDMSLSVFADAGIALGDVPGAVSLPQDGTARVSISARGREIGDHTVTVVLTTPDGQTLRKVLVLPVRDNDAETSVTRQFTLAPGERFTFDRNVFAGFRPGTGTATLSAGPLARMDVPGLLQQLDRYPYGCTEQVTSAAMPLLYHSQLAQAVGIGDTGQIAQKIDAAISRILARQSSNGAFGLWRAQSGEFWLDAYVTDFLSRARAEGHAVPDLAFALAMDNLRNRVNYAPDFDNGGEDLAYALLVLTREGAAAIADLRYYADTKAENFATPLAVAQLGAALALYGDPVRADAMFRLAGAKVLRASDNRSWRSDFGSTRRDRAAVLKLSAEVGSQALDQVALAASLGQTDRLSTQEAAQVALAAHALADPNASSGLRVDGQLVPGPIVQTLSDQSVRASEIENTSDAPLDVTMTAFGVPEVAPEADGYGFKITRRIFTMDGESVASDVASGTRMVVVLEVTPFETVGARMIVDDPLPAGFEIDNPNLISSGDVRALDWLETSLPETVEFRSDRFVAAVDHRGSEPFRLAYVVRAVTPGSYHHPAATTEDMYRPAYRANTATGRVTVTP